MSRNIWTLVAWYSYLAVLVSVLVYLSFEWALR
jgi:hypothetical protein